MRKLFFFKSAISLLFIVAISSFLPACSDSSGPNNETVEYFSWQYSTPAEQGIDTVVIKDVVLNLEEVTWPFSFLIWRNGYLVFEKYFNGKNSDDPANIHSVSKSITSALLGIALERNYINSLDQKMYLFFPEYRASINDSRKFDITLEHLITMRAGFRFDEDEEHWTAYAGSPDWVRYAISLPLDFNPGMGWDYSTPQTNLLSAIITKSSGMPTRDFAELYLLNDLGINIHYWHRDPQGYYTGGHAVFMRPREMIKFGYLYLKNGKFNDKQLVPLNWMEKVTETFQNPSYSYGWWLHNSSFHNYFAAMGRGGQLIVIVRELDLIIVTTSNADTWQTSGQANSLINYCENIMDTCVE